MTTLNTIIEEEVVEQYAQTIQDMYFLAGAKISIETWNNTKDIVKNAVTTAIQRAYEAGQSEERAKVREEVEKARLPVEGEMVDEARLVRKSFNAGLDAVLAKLTPDKTTEV